MNQFKFEAIVKIIQAGAPALAKELTDAFVEVVESQRTLALHAEELEKQLKSYREVKPEVKEEE